MSTRQAKSIHKIRRQRVRAGLCHDCGGKSAGYRCERCNANRREYMRLLMRRRKW